MKYLLLSSLFLFCFSSNINAQAIAKLGPTIKDPNMVDYNTFLKMTKEIEPIRSKQLIDLEEFKCLMKEEGVLLLDTRSKEAYEARHIKGAVHLNFSEFTSKKLPTVIPSKDTKIIFYCNNNFYGNINHLVSKMPPLALNIPTFINLYGYGYKNIYELKGLIDLRDDDIEMAGTDAELSEEEIARMDLMRPLRLFVNNN